MSSFSLLKKVKFEVGMIIAMILAYSQAKSQGQTNDKILLHAVKSQATKTEAFQPFEVK